MMLVLWTMTSFHKSVYGSTGPQGEFCYHDYEGCGPNTEAWPSVCHEGKFQSPINLPSISPSRHRPWVALRLLDYRGSSFRLHNNGHSVSIDFEGRGTTRYKLFPFPEPRFSQGFRGFNDPPLLYKFDSAHFHWGTTDFNAGSEHCISGRCYALELHFVHYLAIYDSLKEAITSGDENALAVLAVLIDVHPIYNRWPNPILAPIVNHLHTCSIANQDLFQEIYEPVDFTNLFFAKDPPMVYMYKGSLTTPGCNEQVNWYVMKEHSFASHSDLMAFRTIVRDHHNVTLRENHRPLQKRNRREIILSRVIPWDE